MGFRKNGDELTVQEIPFAPSTIETIDMALFDWVNEDANIFCTFKEGFQKVPAIWLSAERTFQRKASGRQAIFGLDGAVDLPLITIERTGLAKDPSKKGTAWANIFPVNDERGGSMVVARRIQQEKTSNFANADSKRVYGQENFRTRKKNKKVVYETITIPQPTYIEATYNINLMSIYQQQMNEMTTPFITTTGNIAQFGIRRDGHFYEAFIDGNFSQQNNSSNLGEEERLYKTTISLKILGYLVGQGQNQEGPRMIVRENAVEVKIPREKVIFGDLNEYLKKNGFFRP